MSVKKVRQITKKRYPHKKLIQKTQRGGKQGYTPHGPHGPHTLRTPHTHGPPVKPTGPPVKPAGPKSLLQVWTPPREHTNEVKNLAKNIARATQKLADERNTRLGLERQGQVRVEPSKETKLNYIKGWASVSNNSSKISNAVKSALLDQRIKNEAQAFEQNRTAAALKRQQKKLTLTQEQIANIKQRTQESNAFNNARNERLTKGAATVAAQPSKNSPYVPSSEFISPGTQTTNPKLSALNAKAIANTLKRSQIYEQIPDPPPRPKSPKPKQTPINKEPQYLDILHTANSTSKRTEGSPYGTNGPHNKFYSIGAYGPSASNPYALPNPSAIYENPEI